MECLPFSFSQSNTILVIYTDYPGYLCGQWHLSDSVILGCGQGPFIGRRRTVGTTDSPLIQSCSDVLLGSHVQWEAKIGNWDTSWHGKTAIYSPVLFPRHELKCHKYRRTPLLRTLVIRIANYPDRPGSLGKFVEKTTKLTCLEITGYRIQYSTVLWLLELQIGRIRKV